MAESHAGHQICEPAMNEDGQAALCVLLGEAPEQTEQEAAGLHMEDESMTHVKETTLLEYVIAYLQEEHDLYKSAQVSWGEPEAIEALVKDALDAYAGGAR